MDPRFTKVLKDPRFKRISRKDNKVKIDSRFEKMFTDNRFHTKFTVDKRGKPLLEIEKEDLNKFYEIEADTDEAIVKSDEEIEFKKKEKKKEKSKGNKQTSKNRNTSIRKNEKKKLKMKEKEKGVEKKGIEEEDEEEDTLIKFADIRGENIENDSDTEASEPDADDLEENIIHGWGELDEDAKRVENVETSRFAVCNCDWDKINATDLFTLFHSFKPTGGAIKSVTIYPSDYGLERMKEEELKGPLELRDSLIDSDEETEAVDNEGKVQGSHFHMEKLREYQLNRMKYYYAIVECDSKNTANAIYEECDGMEYEMSATRLDLRFVSNGTTFENPPKAVCTELPSIKSYQPANFLNTALQQSKVRLTWDETDPRRLQVTMRKFGKEDLEDFDFQDYLASSSSEEEEVEGEHKKPGERQEIVETSDNVVEDVIGNDSEDDDQAERIKKYQLLVKEIEAKEKQEKDSEENGNMEVTWTPGIDTIGEKVLRQKTNKVHSSDNESGVNDADDTDHNDEIGDDAGFNDPFFSARTENQNHHKTKKKKKKRNKVTEESLTEEEKKKKEELELLLMDESENKKHFSLKTILEQNKTNSKKKRKRKGEQVEEDTFQLDLEDTRFNALYTSHLYALDPVDANFKKTKASEAIIKEKQKRRENGLLSQENERKQNDTKFDPSLSALVKSVKSKTLSHQSKKRKKL